MKTSRWFVTFLLITILLSACAPAATPTAVQPTSAPAATNPPPPTTAPTKAPPPTAVPTAVPTVAPTAAPPVVVSVWVSDLKPVQMAAAAYEKATGQKVVVQEIAREVLQEKEKTELTGKTGSVDLLLAPSEWLAELAEGGLLEPLDTYMANAKLSQPDKNDWASVGLVDSYNYKGKQFGFPVSAGTEFLYYRKDLISKPPDTWDEYLKIAQEQTTATRYGTTLFGKLPESISWDFINFFWSYGGKLLDDKFQPTVNSKEGVAALTFYSDLLQKYKVVPPGVPTYEYPEVLAAFQQDKAAMVIQWDAAYSTFADKAQSPLIYDKFDVAPLPGFKNADGTISRATIAHVWGFVMNASSKNKDAAYNFLVYLTGKEGLKLFAMYGDEKEVNSKAVLSDPEVLKAHPEFAMIEKAFPSATLWPTTTGTSGLILALAQEASAALTGIKTPQKAMDDAQKAIQDVMKQAGY